VDVLLDREQHLIGIHGLDEVVGDLRSHGLVHDVLLLALGDHDDGCRRAHLLDLGQGFESGHTGHHLVEDNQVVGPFGGHVYRVVSVVAGVHLVAFLREKQHVRFQQFHFVVHPEYFDHSAVVIGIRKNSDFTSQTQKPGGLLDRPVRFSPFGRSWRCAPASCSIPGGKSGAVLPAAETGYFGFSAGFARYLLSHCKRGK